MLTLCTCYEQARVMKQPKTDRLHVMATPDQKAVFEAAAQAEGLSLSAWVIRTLLMATKRHSLPQNERE